MQLGTKLGAGSRIPQGIEIRMADFGKAFAKFRLRWLLFLPPWNAKVCLTRQTSVTTPKH